MALILAMLLLLVGCGEASEVVVSAPPECLDLVIDAVAFWQAEGASIDVADRGTVRVEVADLAGNDLGRMYSNGRLKMDSCEDKFARQTMLHELGHALGLGHHPDPRNLMFHYQARDGSNLALDDTQRSHVQSSK